MHGRSAGGARVSAHLPPWKKQFFFYHIGGYLLPFFHMRAFLLRLFLIGGEGLFHCLESDLLLFLYLGPFSPCGGLFATFFSMWDFFLSLWETFFVLTNILTYIPYVHRHHLQRPLCTHQSRVQFTIAIK